MRRSIFVSKTLITITSAFAIGAIAEKCAQLAKFYPSVQEATRGVLSNDQIFVWPHETGVHIMYVSLLFVLHIMNMIYGNVQFSFFYTLV